MEINGLKHKHMLCLLFLPLLFLACENALTPLEKAQKAKDGFTVTLHFPQFPCIDTQNQANPNRSAFPGTDSVAINTEYTFTATLSSEDLTYSSEVQGTGNGDSYNFNFAPIDAASLPKNFTLSVSVTAQNILTGQSAVIATGQNSFSLTQGGAVNQTVYLNPQTITSEAAYGTLNLSVHVEDTDVTNARLRLFNSDKQDVTDTYFTTLNPSEAAIPADRNIRIIAGLPGGIYTMQMSFLNADKVLYTRDETITVYPTMTTDRWWVNGPGSDTVLNIEKPPSQTEFWVRGTGGDFYAAYFTDAAASDTNSGTCSSPLATVQEAVNRINASTDSSAQYTICIDGKISADGTNYSANNNAMVYIDGSRTITIKGFTSSEKDSIDATGSPNTQVIYVQGASANLTLKNIKITGADIQPYTTLGRAGGGIYFGGKDLTLIESEISSNANNETAGGGLYLNASGSFNFISGKIRSNQSYLNGGGLYVYTGTVNMSGGEISENTSSARGGGVCVSNISTAAFNIESSAYIPAGTDGKNDVYLATGKTLNITGPLTSAPPVATITPQTYSTGTQVLSGMIASEYTKFSVTPNGGTSWLIGADGILKQSVPQKSIYVSVGGSNNGAGTQGSPYASLSKAFEAIQAATSPSDYTIYISGNIKGCTTVGTAIDANNAASITIEGVSGTTPVLNANGDTTSPVLIINTEVPMTIKGISITGGSNVNAGGIYLNNYASLTLIDTSITNCKAPYASGGAIYAAQRSKLYLKNGVTLSGNSAGYGGALYTSGETVIEDGVTIKDNTATDAGGAICVGGTGTLTVRGGSITGNSVTDTGSTPRGCGGGIFVDADSSSSGSVILEGGTIKSNTAGNRGSGICIYKEGSISMGKNVTVDPDNDIALGSNPIQITEGFTSATTVARITPQTYSTETQVQVLLGDSALIASEYTKFSVTPNGGTSWLIGADGKLTQP